MIRDRWDEMELELNRALAESAEMKWILVGNYSEAGGV